MCKNCKLKELFKRYNVNSIEELIELIEAKDKLLSEYENHLSDEDTLDWVFSEE